ncbi:MAG: MFS transporter [Verrucomicrobiae bacterium]|nr:MFS transporter [Verrucomicrobiae bacterium]
MNAIRRQFFFSYGAIGSVAPLMSVFLWKEAGFGLLQIGFATALANVPMLLSPALMTLLADRNVDSRRILAGAFLVSCTVMLLMHEIDLLWVRLTLFLFHGLAFVAMLPLQDGFFFSYAESRRHLGENVDPYPSVRVWGTIGFIIPSLILYFLLRNGGPISQTLLCGFGFGLASLINTFTLPEVRRAPESSDDNPATRRSIPTAEAFRRLISPKARFLCLGLALGYMATLSYNAFIAVYYGKVIGIPSQYIGLVINLGVVVEVLCTLWMPKLQSVLRLKGIMVVGLCGMVTRMILVAAYPTVWTAVLTQLVHGMEVLALYIAPVMFLDRLAGDRFRNSIQGVFTMTVGGFSRISGALVAGFIASHDLRWLMGYASVLGLAAMAVIVFLFKRIPPSEEMESSLAHSKAATT